MTSRSDVKKETLIYTCNCGFIDRHHATPGNYSALWQSLQTENNFSGWPSLSNRQHSINGQAAFGIYWGLRMKKDIGLRFAVGDLQPYLVRKGLGIEQKKSILLRIAMEESVRFERLQATVPYSWFIDSGFSAEDLTSNLLGMYQALGTSWDEVLRVCKKTDTQTALDMYDQHFPDGIGERKVTRFYQPMLFACKACPEPQRFPEQFSRIRPADIGTGTFIRVDRRLVPAHTLARYSIDFHQDGRPLDFRIQ